MESPNPSVQQLHETFHLPERSGARQATACHPGPFRNPISEPQSSGSLRCLSRRPAAGIESGCVPLKAGLLYFAFAAGNESAVYMTNNPSRAPSSQTPHRQLLSGTISWIPRILFGMFSTQDGKQEGGYLFAPTSLATGKADLSRPEFLGECNSCTLPAPTWKPRVFAGLLKRYICPFETCCFFHQNNGKPQFYKAMFRCKMHPDPCFGSEGHVLRCVGFVDSDLPRHARGFARSPFFPPGPSTLEYRPGEASEDWAP